MNARVQPHNVRVAEVWGAAGADYDEISRGIADAIDHCVDRLNPQPGERILDLSTGTGWTSRVVARMGAAVLGVDISDELLEAARARAEAARLPIDYQIGDAESLPFEDGAFDAIVSTFGIMFASRPAAAADELARVCRKGGRIALTTWPPESSVFALFKMLKRYMPRAPHPTPRSPFSWSSPPPSPFEWGSSLRIRELLGRAFRLRFEKGVSYYHEPSGEAAWDTFSRGFGPARSLLAGLDAARRAELRKDFTAFHSGFPTELGICVPREYCLITGVRV
jgi:ubiquinone/menaquinone biosynthesis C-methylase UbiE